MQRIQGLDDKLYLAPGTDSATTTTVTYQAETEGTLTCTIDQVTLGYHGYHGYHSNRNHLPWLHTFSVSLTPSHLQSAAAVVSSTTNSDLGNGKLQLFTVSITPPNSLEARVDAASSLSSPTLSLTCTVDSLSVNGVVQVIYHDINVILSNFDLPDS